MTNYEVLYIISPKTDDKARDELVAKFEEIVTAAGGTASVNKWGMRKLAYDINFVSEGYYVLMEFSAPETIPQEIERQMRITDGILRFLVTKKISNKLTRAEAERRAENARRAEAARAREEAKAAEAAAKAEEAKEEEAPVEEAAEPVKDAEEVSPEVQPQAEEPEVKE